MSSSTDTSTAAPDDDPKPSVRLESVDTQEQGSRLPARDGIIASVKDYCRKSIVHTLHTLCLFLDMQLTCSSSRKHSVTGLRLLKPLETGPTGIGTVRCKASLSHEVRSFQQTALVQVQHLWRKLRGYCTSHLTHKQVQSMYNVHLKMPPIL